MAPGAQCYGETELMLEVMIYINKPTLSIPEIQALYSSIKVDSLLFAIDSESSVCSCVTFSRYRMVLLRKICYIKKSYESCCMDMT